MDESVGYCFNLKEMIPKRFCTTPIHARTEFTPRANPEKTGLQNIIKINELGYLPHVQSKNVYNGPNVHNPLTELPEGAVDVLAIVSNGREQGAVSLKSARRRLDSFEPGLGWQMVEAKSGYCDGSYNSECGREPDFNCLIQGHNDARGGVLFNSLSGWLVMTLPAVKEGIITLKMETWHMIEENKMTASWKTENGKRRVLRSSDQAHLLPNATQTYPRYQSLTYEEAERALKKRPPPEYCDTFKFEFAINGKVTAWDKTQFQEKSKNPQRVVEVQTILDDPKFTSEATDVEVAIRMSGCIGPPQKTFKLSHVYWA